MMIVPTASYLRRAPFLSYSLNSEDVIINRLFGEKRAGFYVDVGAADPVFENDTFALYSRGWRGINFEPSQQFFNKLQSERPRDINLPYVASDVSDTTRFYEVVGTGLSTCDQDQAQRYREGGREVRESTVRTMTLAEALLDAKATAIDLLKIDVEGFEDRVLRGNDWDRFRPRLVIVEATFPETAERRPTQIAAFMEQRGYRHAHFDGLNDFFLDRSFESPPDAFLPPNVFDRILPRRVDELERANAHLEQSFDEAQRYALSLREANEAKDARLVEVERDNLRLNLDAKGRESEIRRLRLSGEQLQGQLERLDGTLGRLRLQLDSSAAAHQAESERRRLEAEGDALRLASSAAALHQAELERLRLQAEVEALRLVRHQLLTSTSWRVTAFLRYVGRRLGRP